jgi:hypothetical protein
MDIHTDAAAAGGAPTDIVQIPAGASEPMSPREAARTLASFRVKQREGATKQPPHLNSPDAEAQEDLSSEALAQEDAASPTETTGEMTEDADPAERTEPDATLSDPPPLEPPRSWSKIARERWAKLDPETQEYLRKRDSDDSAALRKAQNEAAGERKAIEAERRKVEQARQQYEKALPAVLATLQQEQAGSFSDIKSLTDVEKLAREDWPRYVLWDAQQKRIAAVQDQLQAATEQQQQEQRLKHDAFVRRELELFTEKVPEIADPAQRAKLQGAAVGMLRELGFSDQELAELWQGRRDLSLHDHRLQLILRDGLRFRDARKAAKEASAKPVPPVQRPGVAQPRGAAQDAVVQSLAKRLDQTGNLKDAARLLAQRRKAAR